MCNASRTLFAGTAFDASSASANDSASAAIVTLGMSAIARRLFRCGSVASRDFLHYQRRYIEVIPHAILVPPFRRDCLMPGNDKIATRTRREIADDRGFDVNRLIHPYSMYSAHSTLRANDQAQPRTAREAGWPSAGVLGYAAVGLTRLGGRVNDFCPLALRRRLNSSPMALMS